MIIVLSMLRVSEELARRFVIFPLAVVVLAFMSRFLSESTLPR